MTKAVVVPVQIQQGALDVTELNAALADGWIVIDMAESALGSILVIVQKEQ